MPKNFPTAGEIKPVRKAVNDSAAVNAEGERYPSCHHELSSEDLLTLLALQQLEDLGSISLKHLLDGASSPAAILDTDVGSFAVAGLKPAARRALLNFLRAPRNSRAWAIAERLHDWLVRSGSHVLMHWDAAFPALLKQIDDCPPFIYLQGDMDLINKKAISIVGTRKPTAYGKAFAMRLAEDLAAEGFVIVSGMAMGIDSAAHLGALRSTGRTVAVWATGLDRVYPASAKQLAADIVQTGVVLTEMPPGTPAKSGFFPRRNRLVSGISVGTIVIEAQTASGSLITARMALEQNREVFAVPGSVYNDASKGCHQLIREGAVLIESAEDVLQALGGFQSRPLLEDGGHPPAAPPNPDQQKLIRVFDGEPLPFEVIQLRCGFEAGRLCELLIELELQGYIAQENGHYCFIRHSSAVSRRP